MPRRFPLRPATDDERAQLTCLARSRTAEARRVQRAQIVLAALDGEPSRSIAQRLGIHPQTVHHWCHRFNEAGLDGFTDQPRSGRPPTYTHDEVAEVVAAALTDPQQLALPFASWTLDRLQAYLNEQKCIGIKRSRIDEILLTEGLRWRKHETWFGARVDPDFAQKRG